MTLRVVAIPLIAATCLGSPATASTITDDEQQVRGRGARDRSGNSGGGDRGASGGSSGENRGGSSTTSRGGGGGEQRRAERRDGEPGTAGRRDDTNQRSANRGDRDRDNQRYAVPRDQDRNRTSGRRDNGPVIVSRNRPDITINIGSSYRGQRYYAPFQYDRWARQYYRWSPIGYVPWSLISGSIGFANFSAYGA